MSAISGFINTIRNAVYGEQVRGAIISALEACYSDVNAPSLQTAAFTAALNAAYAGGILDIQTVTQISSMTNQQIIYRYNGTQAGYQKGLYYYSALSSSWVLIGSEIHSVSLLSQMTDTNAIYKYTGTQSDMVQNSLYCYNGTAWVPIGSGVLTASTAALMTNEGAIYKYTGTQTGYVPNALYYHNGTAWVPVSPVTSAALVGTAPANAEAVSKYVAKDVDTVFERGTLSIADGSKVSDSNNFRTADYISPSVAYIASDVVGNKLWAFVYSSTGTYMGVWNGTSLVKNDATAFSPCPAVIDLMGVYAINTDYKVKVAVTSSTSVSDDDITHIRLMKQNTDPRTEEGINILANLLVNAAYISDDVISLRNILLKRFPVYATKYVAASSTIDLAKNTSYPITSLFTPVPTNATEKPEIIISNSSLITYTGTRFVTGNEDGTTIITIEGKLASKTVTVNVGTVDNPLITPTSYRLNYSVYFSNLNQSFDSIQAPVDARALLISPIATTPNKLHTITVSQGYFVAVGTLDENNLLKAAYGNDMKGRTVSFTPSTNVTSFFIVIKTPTTSTANDITSANATLTVAS